jgi:hypothetical protein
MEEMTDLLERKYADYGRKKNILFGILLSNVSNLFE